MRLFYFVLVAVVSFCGCHITIGVDDGAVESDSAEGVDIVEGAEGVAGVAATIQVNQPIANRVAITTDSDARQWYMTWEDGDDLACWTTGGATLSHFEMTDISDDGSSAAFDGEVQANSTLRMIYPYDASATVTSDGHYEVDLSRQSVDLSDPYNSMADEKMYMVSDLVTIGDDGTSSDEPYMSHVMSALEIYFTPSSNINTATYDYRLYEVEIYCSSTNKTSEYYYIYTSGYIDLSQEEALFVADDSNAGVISVEVENSPILQLGETVVIPAVIAPTTLKKISYASTYLYLKFKVHRTHLESGDVSEDSCMAVKLIDTSTGYELASGTYNIITAQGGAVGSGYEFDIN